MEAPKISVIIPVYNVEKYLARCLDSILDQSLRELEVVCVNDASPDNSSKILAEYAAKDSRVRVITKEKNEGLMMARKTGYQNAHGEYFFFLDSDDYLLPDALNRLYLEAKKQNADIGVADFYYVNQHGEKTYRHRTQKLNDEPKTFLKEIFINTPCNIWGIIFHRSLFSTHNYFTFMKQSFYEDRILMVQILPNAKKIATVNFPVLAYTYNEGAMTRNRLSEDKLMEQLRGMNWVLDYMSQFDDIKRQSTIHYLKALSFLIESDYPTSILTKSNAENDKLLTFNSLKEHLGARLGAHTWLSLHLPLYRKTAFASRLALRKLLRR